MQKQNRGRWLSKFLDELPGMSKKEFLCVVKKIFPAEYFFQLVDSWIAIFMIRDQSTFEHCLRVKSLSLRIGLHLELSKEQMVFLFFAALFHDIGKVGVSGRILNQPRKLRMIEKDKLRIHPKITSDFLSQFQDQTWASQVAFPASSHHEWWDGSGYLHGLREKEIPLSARIITVADAYDALSSERSYLKEQPRQTQTQILDQLSGKERNKFDPDVLEVLIYIFGHSSTVVTIPTMDSATDEESFQSVAL